jgi:hypothetical protein
MNSFKKRVRRSPRGIVVYCLKINNALLNYANGFSI